MFKVKRFFATLISILLITSFASCNSNATWILKVQGESLPVGVYIYNLMIADSEAKSKIDEQLAKAETTTEGTTAAEATTGAASSTEGTTASTTQASTTKPNYYKEKIDGVSSEQWIKDRALQKCKELIAVEKKFDELKLTLSEEDQKYIDESLPQNWESNGPLLEMNGISKSSFERVEIASRKSNAIFNYYHGKGGIQEVPETQIKDLFKQKFATVKVLTQSKTKINESGQQLPLSDSDKEKIETELKVFEQRLKNEKDFSEIKKEFEDEMNAIVQPTTAAPETTAPASTEPTTSNTGTTEPTTAAPTTTGSPPPTTQPTTAVQETTEPTESPDVVLISKDSENNASTGEVIKKMFNAKVGETGIVETEESFFLFIRVGDLESNPYYYNYTKDQILQDLKGDDFEKVIAGFTSSIIYTVNDHAVKAYVPKKLKLD